MNRVKVMGIVNVTPDSFSDGGKYFKSSEACRRAENMIEEGADILDIGGESTRPGAEPVEWSEEWSRIKDVVLNLVGSGVPLSVDTYHPQTAQRAVDSGVKIINCVKKEPLEQMLGILRKNKDVLLISDASYWGISPFVSVDTRRIDALYEFKGRIWLDPMIGFSTTREEDLSLIRHLPHIAKHAPTIVGASRKRIVKKLTGQKVTGKNLGGNLAIAAWCALNGASAVRVHDVEETVQMLKVIGAIETV